MDAKKYKPLLPVFVLVSYSIKTFITAVIGEVEMGGEYYDFQFLPGHFVALVFIALCFASFGMARSFFKYVLAATILLGLFNFAIFSPLETKTGVGIGGLQIMFQPAAFLALIVACVINRDQILSLFFTLKPPEATMQHAEQLRTEQIEKFKERYANYSEEELQRILADSRFVPEAIEAARQELSGRKAHVDPE